MTCTAQNRQSRLCLGGRFVSPSSIICANAEKELLSSPLKYIIDENQFQFY